MKAPLVRVVIASAIFLVLLTQIFAAPTPPPDSMTLGVKLNDSFTFVVSKIVNPSDPNPMLSMGPGIDSDIEIELHQGDTFTMSITNTTIGNDINFGHFLEVTLANTSHSIITEVPLAPGIGAVSFTNWTAWETVINGDPLAYFDTGYLNHTIIRDYAEFSIRYWIAMEWNATTTVYFDLLIVYELLTGVSVNQEVKTHNFAALGSDDVEWIISRQGYIKPPPPSSTTTTTTTSSTIAPPTSSTTSGATSSASGTATSSTTSVVTTTTTTSTVTSTATSTATSTVTTTNTTTTVAATNTTSMATTTSNTTTSSTRDLAIFTPTSTLDRNTTEESSETAESASGDQESSSDVTLPLPGFGVILSFTALITTITVIRYKKH